MKQRLDTYDELPRDMRRYLSHNGWHFNKKACNMAIAHMKRLNPSTGKLEKITPRTKEQIDNILKSTGITLQNSIGYDYVYIANMVYADFWGSSINDETQLSKYIKDVIDDADQADGYIFNRWLADMCINGIPIEWEDII